MANKKVFSFVVVSEEESFNTLEAPFEIFIIYQVTFVSKLLEDVNCKLYVVSANLFDTCCVITQ
jgi:hypothetical protein